MMAVENGGETLINWTKYLNIDGKGLLTKMVRDGAEVATAEVRHADLLARAGGVHKIPVLLRGDGFRGDDAKTVHGKLVKGLTQRLLIGIGRQHRLSGTLHLDLKLDNVCIDPLTGHIRLLDYGLAIPCVDTARLKRSGGTWGYKDARNPKTKESDIYAIGWALLLVLGSIENPFLGARSLGLHPPVKEFVDELVLRTEDDDDADGRDAQGKVQAFFKSLQGHTYGTHGQFACVEGAHGRNTAGNYDGGIEADWPPPLASHLLLAMLRGEFETCEVALNHPYFQEGDELTDEEFAATAAYCAAVAAGNAPDAANTVAGAAAARVRETSDSQDRCGLGVQSAGVLAALFAAAASDESQMQDSVEATPRAP